MAFSKYLSKTEKTSLVPMIALLGLTEEYINKLGEIQSTDKQYLKYLRSAKTFLDKAIELRLQNLEPDAQKNLRKCVLRQEPVCFMASNEAKREAEILEKMQSFIHMSRDDFQDWYGEVIEFTCQDCHKTNHKECPVYQILLNNNIVPVNPMAIDSCPYDYAYEDPELKNFKEGA